MDNPITAQKLENTLRPDQVNPSDYAAILFAGGHGTMWDFPTDASLHSLARFIYEKGGIVAAVCHGPAALVRLKLANGHYLVEDKHIAPFTDEEETAVGLANVVPFLLASKLVEQGARHEKAELWQSMVVVDGRLITGQNPASATGVGEAIAEVLAQNKKQFPSLNYEQRS
jgi:putative intracellular protease/amidase